MCKKSRQFLQGNAFSSKNRHLKVVFPLDGFLGTRCRETLSRKKMSSSMKCHLQKRLKIGLKELREFPLDWLHLCDHSIVGFGLCDLIIFKRGGALSSRSIKNLSIAHVLAMKLTSHYKLIATKMLQCRNGNHTMPENVPRGIR